MKTDPHLPDWLSASELQEWLGLGRTKTYALLNEEIPTHRLGQRTLRVRRQDVEEWLRANRRTHK